MKSILTDPTLITPPLIGCTTVSVSTHDLYRYLYLWPFIADLVQTMDMKQPPMDVANQKNKVEEEHHGKTDSNVKNKKLGGVRTMPFILGQ